jgi:hypothetical protein
VSPKAKIVLVAAVCAAPLILGTLVYWSGWTVGTPGNYGELLPPRVVAAPPLEALRGKWVLVSFDAAACGAHCEKKLYFMRQARRAQGKEMERVERLWILTDSGAPRAELLVSMEGTLVGRMSSQGFPGNAKDHIYVVDPLGNLMMRFPRDPDPSRIIKDLQRLLKLSRVG